MIRNVWRLQGLNAFVNDGVRKGCRSLSTVVSNRNVSTSSSASTSTSSSKVEEEDNLVKIEIDNNIATLILNRKPVNSLSFELLTAISSSIKEVEKDRKVNSLIIKSSSRATFSAGLDLTELYNPSPTRLPKFWRSFQQLFIDLYGSRLATVAAIEGHAPAAGCMIALSCDNRVMGNKAGVIGLNESKFGICAPPWLGQLMLRSIGFRNGEKALALGTLYTPQEALSLGLVDRVVEQEDVLGVAREVAEEWSAIPPHALVACKTLSRKEFIDDLIQNRDEDVDYFCNFITNDKVQAGLGAYLESLKNKK